MRILFLLLIMPFVMKAQTEDDPKVKAKEKIEAIRKRVLSGESFTELAAQYSEDPGSAKAGGIYKQIVRGMMVPEFEEQAFKLKPGELSEVFETMYGYHFLQVMDRRGEEVDVRHILIGFK
jgi:peptidyl-prolyl cis-trans isomerase SurA